MNTSEWKIVFFAISLKPIFPDGALMLQVMGAKNVVNEEVTQIKDLCVNFKHSLCVKEQLKQQLQLLPALGTDDERK